MLHLWSHLSTSHSPPPFTHSSPKPKWFSNRVLPSDVSASLFKGFRPSETLSVPPSLGQVSLVFHEPFLKAGPD